MVKITTFNRRLVSRVRYRADGTVILELNEQRPDGRARHLRVSLAQWLAGRRDYSLDQYLARCARARKRARRRYRAMKNTAVFEGVSNRE